MILQRVVAKAPGWLAPPVAPFGFTRRYAGDRGMIFQAHIPRPTLSG